jgi:hypothetical protein
VISKRPLKIEINSKCPPKTEISRCLQHEQARPPQEEIQQMLEEQ